MHYDPLNGGSADPSRPTTARFVNVRHPGIFSTKLTPLEWSDSRKRPRPDAASAPVASAAPSSSNAHRRGPDDNNPSAHSAHAHQQHSQHQRPPEAQPPLRVETREVVRIVEKHVPIEPITVLGCPPLVDDRVRHVVNFMLQHVNSPNVEVEAKLGCLKEKNENVRAVEIVPVMCETPITARSSEEVRFESDVGEDFFYRINEELNKRVEDTQGSSEGSVRYFRTKEVDVYYPGRVRETRALRQDADGTERYERLRVQRKTRLGDMNVLCPGRLCDVRYSASKEEDCSLDDSLHPTMERIKDRISYKYECLSIDITCVNMQGKHDAASGKTHEVEIEVDASTASLYEEVEKYRKKDESSKLFDIASHLVNTVRILLEL